VLPLHPVENVPPQRVSFGHLRMIEISVEIAPHADTLHHPTRSPVAGSGERNNFR
jgi:hypothetical protein